MTRDERLERLESWCQQLRQGLDLYAEQLAEQSLRIRFIMAAIELKMPNPSSLIIDGGKPALITSDLYQQYMTGGRERMLMTLEQEMHEAQAALQAAREKADGNGSGTSNGEAEGAASGTGTLPASTGSDPPHPGDAAAPGPHGRPPGLRLTDKPRPS